jgi:hypothetical protein
VLGRERVHFAWSRNRIKCGQRAEYSSIRSLILLPLRGGVCFLPLNVSEFVCLNHYNTVEVTPYNRLGHKRSHIFLLVFLKHLLSGYSLSEFSHCAMRIPKCYTLDVVCPPRVHVLEALVPRVVILRWSIVRAHLGHYP